MIIISITIISAPCGAGKTTWAIKSMNENADGEYIYCTPFLDEIKRIRRACGWERFKEPQVYNSSKIDDFNHLIIEHESIAVTHSTFLNANEDTIQALREADYTLIIDEALDVIANFNEIQSVENDQRQSMMRGDIQAALDNKTISVGKSGLVKWNTHCDYEDYKLSEVKRLAEAKRLYLVDDVLFVTVYPPEVFGLFKDIYVLTYIHEGNTLLPYFDIFRYQYSIKTLVDGEIVEYSTDCDMEYRQRFKSLLNICNDKRLNDNKSLSQTWYKKRKPSELETLASLIRSFFNTHVKKMMGESPTARDIMWTCPKTYEKQLSGKGYTKAIPTKEELSQCNNEKEREALKEKYKCFVPCNARATNAYQNRWALAYCMDMYPNPYIEKFFSNFDEELIERGQHPVRFNRDAFAVSCLVQWICRSRIRKNEAVALYLPSQRMRKLLAAWIDNGTDALLK